MFDNVLRRNRRFEQSLEKVFVDIRPHATLISQSKVSHVDRVDGHDGVEVGQTEFSLRLEFEGFRVLLRFCVGDYVERPEVRHIDSDRKRIRMPFRHRMRIGKASKNGKVSMPR